MTMLEDGMFRLVGVSPPFLTAELKISNFTNDCNLDTSSLTILQICLVSLWIKFDFSPRI